jgi:hypothetical protein
MKARRKYDRPMIAFCRPAYRLKLQYEVANKSFEDEIHFTHLGIDVPNENCIHKEKT